MTSDPSLAKINTLLREADFTAITLNTEQYNKLKTSDSLSSILNALSKAKNHDAGARKYVEQSLNKIFRHTETHGKRKPGNFSTCENEHDRSPPMRYISHHVYGKSSALEFSARTARNECFETVFIDAAKVIPNSKNINWKEKITVQLTESELPIVAAVFCGHLDNCHFANHGPENNKGFEIAQNQKPENREKYPYLVKVFQTDRGMHVVPMTKADSFYVTQIVLAQLQRNLPHQNSTLMLAGLRLIGSVD